MAENSPSPTAVERGHEIREINTRAVIALGIGVTLAMIVSALIVYLIIDASTPSEQETKLSGQRPVFAPAPSGALPGTPTTSPEELAARQAATLHGYRWIDKEAGIVSIPIERAMVLITERGLPKFGPRPASPTRRQ